MVYGYLWWIFLRTKNILNLGVEFRVSVVLEWTPSGTTGIQITVTPPLIPGDHVLPRTQLSTLAGMTVSSDHPTTLQQLNELDVLTDAKVEAIIRLSE